jgi:hypothetical protein
MFSPLHRDIHKSNHRSQHIVAVNLALREKSKRIMMKITLRAKRKFSLEMFHNES